MKDNKLIGDLGESMAVGLLYGQGYQILETKYRCKVGEIDIIACKDNEVSFIEVKTRQSLCNGTPAEAVNQHKQLKIRRAAQMYLQQNRRDEFFINFQVIEILINQIKGAF